MSIDGGRHCEGCGQSVSPHESLTPKEHLCAACDFKKLTPWTKAEGDAMILRAIQSAEDCMIRLFGK